MRKYSDDASCAKLIMKKSSGHLRISIIIFLITITITMMIGILYARQYFQYEKDFLNNIAVKTVYVDSGFSENTVRSITSSDINTIKKNIKEKFPDNKIIVIPVYTCMGIYMNGKSVNLFAVDKENCFFVDLGEMLDGTAYFTEKQPDTVALEINVTEETEGGFSSGELKRLLLKSAAGVSEKTPILTAQNNSFMPSMKEDPICFVNIETFKDVVSILCAKNVENINELADNSELVTLSAYVYVDDLSLVSPVSSLLTEQNYRAYATTDSFDDFGETVSVTLIVFMLSSVALLCMTTVNIFLSFKSFYRVQQRDMGVLKYMGFDDRRIYNMYCKNIREKFLHIMLICSAIIIVSGAIMFSFEHWIVLLTFILSLFVFLSLIYVAISRIIILKYLRQDILVLIRESKEFE